jgi:hypothetical protein
LGKPSRRFGGEDYLRLHLVWDKLGVVVSSGELDDDQAIVYQVRFYFQTLSGREGCQGGEAIGDDDLDDYEGCISKRELKALKAELSYRPSALEDKLAAYDPKAFFYPLQPVKSLTVQGVSIRQKALISKLNAVFGSRNQPRFGYTGTSQLFFNSDLKGEDIYKDHYGYYTLKDQMDCNGNRWTTRAFLSRSQSLFHISVRIY